jgi:hypothetical protein
MARGKGIKRRVCYCQTCRKDFLACREDAVSCSAKCRKARNRLLGGSIKAVTEMPDESPGLSVTKREGEGQ